VGYILIWVIPISGEAVELISLQINGLTLSDAYLSFTALLMCILCFTLRRYIHEVF
jgi:hypothetical protein